MKIKKGGGGDIPRSKKKTQLILITSFFSSNKYISRPPREGQDVFPKVIMPLQYNYSKMGKTLRRRTMKIAEQVSLPDLS